MKYIVLLLSLFIHSCDNNVQPIPLEVGGEITINSDVIDNKFVGFSFKFGGSIEYPNASNIIPDIRIFVYNRGENEIGASFRHGIFYTRSFSFIKEISDADSAMIFFNSFAEAPELNYVESIFPVRKNQIWAVKTIDNEYGKILILDVKVCEDTSNTSRQTRYAEVTFKWKYQVNGSRKF